MRKFEPFPSQWSRQSRRTAGFALYVLWTTLFFGMFAGLTPAQSNDLFEDLEEDCEAAGPAYVFYLKDQGRTRALACGLERDGGPSASAESRFLIASVSKTFLSVALLQAHENGLLNIEDPVSKWLPQDINEAFDGLEGISIANLLTMSSGIPDYLDDTYYPQSIAMIKRGASSGDILRWAILSVAKEPVLFDPGTAFDYSNTNYLLAQLVLERAVSAPMHRVFEKQIYKPANMSNTRLLGFGVGPKQFVHGFEDLGSGLEPVDRYLIGYGFGDGGLVTTASEIVRFYEALFVAKTLLSEAGLQLLLKDPTGEGYGMGIEIENLPGNLTVYGHSGGDIGFSADVRHLAGKGTTSVFLSAEADDDLSVTRDLLASYQGTRFNGR